MQDVAPPQVFVRNDKGRLWGPLAPQSLELLLDNGLIEGRIQLSIDGLNFAWPGRFEDLREFVPTELWGDGLVPQRSTTGDAQTTAQAAQPTEVPPVANRAPVAGPGAVPLAGPGTRVAAAAMAGPGALNSSQAARPPAAAQPLPRRPTQAERPAPAAQPAARPATPSHTAAAPAPATTSTTIAEPLTALPSAGDLARVSPIRLYFLAASGQLTGKLSAHLGDRQLEVSFRKGNPEHVGSSHPDDSVAAFVARERLTSPEKLAAAEAEKERFGGELLAALFGTGALNPATAFAQLAQRAQAMLLRLVLAESGHFNWTAEELHAHKAMPLGNRWGVLMELVRKVPPAEVRRRMAPAADFPVMKSGGLVALSDLRLTPQETRAMGFVDGVRSLNLLARDLPQDADAFFRLAWVLREMDIVSFAATRLPTPSQGDAGAPASARRGSGPRPAVVPPVVTPPQIASAPAPSSSQSSASASVPPRVITPPPQPAVARPPPPTITAAPVTRPQPPVMSSAPAQAPAPAAPTDFTAELSTLRELLLKQKDQNHFEVLALSEKTDGAQVKAAYFKLARLHHPDTVPPGAPAELGKLKADIFARVGEAYRTLGDDGSRARYLEELKSGGAGEVDVSAILHAEELFQKGCILVKARRFPQALELLNEAIGINAEEGEFYAWRGAARFFSEKDPKKGEAEANADFETALKRNPRCAAAWFFRGQIARVQGDAKKAVGHFKKALDLQPDHLDAQREIRYLTKK